MILIHQHTQFNYGYMRGPMGVTWGLIGKNGKNFKHIIGLFCVRFNS